MPRAGVPFTGCLIILAACSVSPEQVSSTPSNDTGCLGAAVDARITCIEAAPSSILAQSPADTEVTVDLSGVMVTLHGTILVTRAENYSLSVATIEGVSVVGAFGTTRVVLPGAQVVVLLGDSPATRAPTIPFPFDIPTIRQAPLDQLPRAVTIPRPIAAPNGFTPPPTITPTFTPTTTSRPTSPSTGAPTATAATPSPQEPTSSPTQSTTLTPGATTCAVREDWTGLYTVQRGDTLARIAQRFDVNLLELQVANCIENADRIFAGQVLRLPPEAFSNIPTVPPPTRTPAAVSFRADQTIIQPGQCTTLRWDVDNVSAVYFEDELTTEHNARQVCPAATADYALLVIDPDGTQRTQTLTITVQP